MSNLIIAGDAVAPSPPEKASITDRLKGTVPFILTAVVPVSSWLLGGPSFIYEALMRLSGQPVSLGQTDEVILNVGISVVLAIAGGIGVFQHQLHGTKQVLLADKREAIKRLEGVSTILRGSNEILSKIPDESSNIIRQTLGAALAGPAALARDGVLASEIFQTAELIAASAKSVGPGEQRIHVCLLRGTRRRYKELAGSLHSNGAFMDSDERRELTTELAEQQNSYAVVMYGVVDILKKGPYQWHEAYVDFVKHVASRGSSRGWVFVSDGQDPNELFNAAAKQIVALGLPCFRADLRPTDALNQVVLARARELGHLLEVFSEEFCERLRTKASRNLPQDVIWKATSLEYSSGRDKPVKEILPPEELKGQKVQNFWSEESVRKRVRAGSLEKDPRLQKYLGHLLENSKEFRA